MGDRVMAFGTPCLDRVYYVDERYLQEHALKKGGWVQEKNYERFAILLKQAGASVSSGIHKDLRQVVKTGGSSSNTLKVLASLGNDTTFYGKLCEDSNCQIYRDMANRLGIRLITQNSKDSITQIAALVTPDAERTFIAYPNLSVDLQPQILSEDLFKGVGLTHFEGYMLWEYSLDFLQAAVSLAKKSGAVVSFDLGNVNIVSSKFQEILSFLSDVDIIFANEDELRAFQLEKSLSVNHLPSEAEAIQNMTLEGFAKKLSQEINAIVVLLQGPKGAFVAFGSGSFQSPACAVANVIDTTGAGDAFAGAFLHGYTRGGSLDECAKMGHIVASAVIQEVGAEISQDKWAKLKADIEAINKKVAR